MVGGQCTRLAVLQRDEQCDACRYALARRTALAFGVAGYWSPVLQRPVPADSAELASRSSLVFACSLSATALAKETEAEKAAKEAAAQEKLLQVFVSEPYLELSTGPGRGYPVFHVVERDASVDVLFRRTDWFKVRDERGVEGWARARDMRRTKLADGSPFVFNLGDRDGFTSHDWEIGHRWRRLRRRQPDQRLRRVFAHRQHEGRAHAVAVPRQCLQRLQGRSSASRT